MDPMWLTLSAIGFAAGLFFFFKGMRIYRKYRVMFITPRQRIGGLPMGLVRVHGKATGAHPIESPLTWTPCYAYEARVEILIGDKWLYAGDQGETGFYLDDGTGSVRMDPEGAEKDLLPTLDCEITRGGRKGAVPAPVLTDEQLEGNAERLAFRPRPGLPVNPGNQEPTEYRLREYCVLEGHWYDVVGTCRQSPAPRDEVGSNVIERGKEEQTFIISWRGAGMLDRSIHHRASVAVLGGALLSFVCLCVFLHVLGQL